MVRERCCCGAEFVVDLRKKATAEGELTAVAQWREQHRHEVTAPEPDQVAAPASQVPPALTVVEPATRPEIVVSTDALEWMSGAAGQFLTLMNRLAGPGQGRSV